MTFAKKIIKRRPFAANIAGLPLSFSFDKRIAEFGDFDGSSKGNGDIILNPALSDNRLLDTACHEIVEVVNERLEWNLQHPLIQQLGWLFGCVIEWDG